MIELGVLYHWSPRQRRASIMQNGLVPGSEATVASSEVLYVCLGTSPREAWSLSGDMDWAAEQEDWDLWEVRLVESDHVRIRAEWGPRLREVRVHNVVPPDRVWWVGERQPWPTDK